MYNVRGMMTVSVMSVLMSRNHHYFCNSGSAVEHVGLEEPTPCRRIKVAEFRMYLVQWSRGSSHSIKRTQQKWFYWCVFSFWIVLFCFLDALSRNTSQTIRLLLASEHCEFQLSQRAPVQSHRARKNHREDGCLPCYLSIFHPTRLLS